MNNMFYAIGRITDESKEIKGGIIVDISITRNYKNSEGIYETDIIPVTMLNGIADKTKEYCKKGDLVGCKGRIQANEGNIMLIAEKVSFLSSHIRQEDVEKSDE